MRITAFNIPHEHYGLAKELGIDTILDADARTILACDEHDLYWMTPTGDDIPLSGLPALQENCLQIAKVQGTNRVSPVLVSATYTRMLDPEHPGYLGTESLEEYYEQFAELAPAATPMLCHYPYHNWELQREAIAMYRYNIRLMQSVFAVRDICWWMWIQISAHNYYDGAWVFRELEKGEITFQVRELVAAGCAGLGYFTWTPLDGDGVVDAEGNPSRHFEEIKQVNQEIA